MVQGRGLVLTVWPNCKVRGLMFGAGRSERSGVSREAILYVVHSRRACVQISIEIEARLLSSIVEHRTHLESEWSIWTESFIDQFDHSDSNWVRSSTIELRSLASISIEICTRALWLCTA